jgi:acetyltransferase-like isoleucine patch superfamily enzyme
LPCKVTIKEGITVSQAVFECDAENKGWLSNSTIKAGATVQGGILTGGISNDGMLADFDFRGSSLIGGMLSGIIVNKSKVGGYFQDVSLAPDTQISGGQLKGNIMGEANAPALIKEAEIFEGSQLSYVTIGENTQIAKGVKIGAGVRLTHNDQIPTGTDLTAALVVNFADNSPPTIDMNTDVLINAPTLLEQINELSEMKDSDWQLVQNPENWQLELTIEGIRFAVRPVQVKQTNSHAKLTIKSDESVIFITAQGREILAYPVIQEMSALIEAVAPLGIHQVALQENGILTAELNDSKVVARTDMAATPVSDDEPLGLFPSELNAMRLIFKEDTGQKRQQRIYPTCAYPETLYNYSFTLVHKGEISITIKGKRYQGIFDYVLSPNENGEQDTQVVLTPVSENGNIVAFEVSYPTGERQMLRLIRANR